MATYLVLNIVFMSVIIAGFKLLGILTWNRKMIRLLVLLLVLTAIFDSFLISVDIVAYSHDKILGIRIGLAPVEDFMYAVLAVVIVPSLWNKFGSNHA